MRLFAAMIRADLARLRSQHSGSFVSTVLYDANLVREAFTSGVVNYTQNLLTLIAVLIYMGFIDWQLTIVVLLGVPLVALVLRRFGRKTRKAAVGAMAETENLSTALMENLDGVRLIKIENREAAEQDRVAEVVARRQRHVIKGANARAFAGPSSDLVAYIVVAAVMAYAGWRAQSGDMTVGGFAAFIGMLLAAGQALRQVTNLATVMSEGFTAARRLFGALDIQPEIREAADAAPLAAGKATFAVVPGCGTGSSGGSCTRTRTAWVAASAAGNTTTPAASTWRPSPKATLATGFARIAAASDCGTLTSMRSASGANTVTSGWPMPTLSPGSTARMLTMPA